MFERNANDYKFMVDEGYKNREILNVVLSVVLTILILITCFNCYVLIKSRKVNVTKGYDIIRISG